MPAIKSSKVTLALGVMWTLSGCDGDLAGTVEGQQELVAGAPEVRPNGRGIGTINQFRKGELGRAKPGNGISYHNGPVMLGTVNVYYIWYGNWAGNSAETILTDFASDIGGSPYYNINTTYYNGSNVHLSNLVHFAGRITDNYSQGISLSDAQIQSIVTAAIGDPPTTGPSIHPVTVRAAADGGRPRGGRPLLRRPRSN